MSRETYHTVIGALLILVGAMVVILLYRSDQPGQSDGDGYRLSASFQSIDGVQPGTPILLAGIAVGEVEKQYLNTATNQAVVLMRIDNGIEIPYDSSLKILSEGIAGKKYLKIGAGGDIDMLEPGGSFEYVQSAVRFEELLQKVILSAEARRLEEQKSDAVEENEEGVGLGQFGVPSLTGN